MLQKERKKGRKKKEEKSNSGDNALFADVKLLFTIIIIIIFASKFENYAKQFALNYYNYH